MDYISQKSANYYFLMYDKMVYIVTNRDQAYLKLSTLMGIQVNGVNHAVVLLKKRLGIDKDINLDMLDRILSDKYDVHIIPENHVYLYKGAWWNFGRYAGMYKVIMKLDKREVCFFSPDRLYVYECIKSILYPTLKPSNANLNLHLSALSGISIDTDEEPNKVITLLEASGFIGLERIDKDVKPKK